MRENKVKPDDDAISAKTTSKNLEPQTPKHPFHGEKTSCFYQGEKYERGFYSARNPAWLGIIEVAWLQPLHHRGRFPPCPPQFFSEINNCGIPSQVPIISHLAKKNIIFKSAFKRGYIYICINSRRVQFWNFPNWSWQTCQKQTLWRFWSIEPNGFFFFNRGAETVLQLPHRTYLERSWHQLNGWVGHAGWTWEGWNQTHLF